MTVLPHVIDTNPLGYLADTDRDRAADLQAAFESPTVRAVICARGGYGSSRIIDFVDWTGARVSRAKVVSGIQ